MRSLHERLRDILEAIEAIEPEHAKGRRAFDGNKLIQIWIVHHLMIIGEATRHVDPAVRRKYPGVPWEKIVGARNVLIHDYTKVDLDVVWGIADKDLPVLKRHIETILNNEPEQTT